VPTEAETINATVTNIIDRDTAYNSFLKLPSAGLRGSNGKNISRIGNGAYLWARSPASTRSIIFVTVALIVSASVGTPKPDGQMLLIPLKA
jgi:hypothetical protein